MGTPDLTQHLLIDRNHRAATSIQKLCAATSIQKLCSTWCCARVWRNNRLYD